MNFQEIARKYLESRGEKLGATPSTLVPDPAKSAATARLYAKLKHNPGNPGVRRAYDQFKTEILAQYRALVDSGLMVEPGPQYANSDAMRADAKSGHLFYHPTGPEMPADHPLAEASPLGVPYNDLFRVVHDVFGHAIHPHTFGPVGEIRAWAEHAKMFSRLARLALTAETHGQNSYVNFGPYSHLPVTERPFAEQKATVLPITHHPVRLARGLLERLKSLFSSSHVPGFTHGPNDGIIHKATDGDGFVRSAAERSAVAQALQRLGFQSHRQDPTKHRLAVDEHTRVAAWLADKHPENPVVAHYRKAAEQLGSPDVVKPQAAPTASGEWPEPPSQTHYTVPAIGPAGKDLTDAAIPLVRFVNTLLARVHGRPALHEATAHEPSEPEREKAPTKPPAVTPLRDKPAITTPLPLADMRGWKKRHQTERERAAEENPVLSIADDTTPIPLVRYPGETGATGDRWKDIAGLVASGTPRAKIVRHLVEKYALSPRAAAATYHRYARAKLRKLARQPVTNPSIRQSHLFRFAGKAVDPQIAGSRLAYHLIELATHYGHSDPELARLALHALHGTAPSGKSFDERGDPYYLLGLRLKAYQKPYGLRSVSATPDDPAVRIGGAYNWDRMNTGFQAENVMRQFLRKNIAGADGLTDRELYTRAAASFGHPKHVPFWDRVKRWLPKYGTGQKYTQNQLQDALHRLADREEDRHELSQGSGPYHQPKDGEYHWKDYFKWTQANKHAKFARTISISHIRGQGNHLFRDENGDWKPQPPSMDLAANDADRLSFADYLAEHGDPRESLVREHDPAANLGRPLPWHSVGGIYGNVHHSFGDGSYLLLHPIPRLLRSRRWLAEWKAPGFFSFRRNFSHRELRDWLNTFEPEVRQSLINSSRDPRRIGAVTRHTRLSRGKKP